MSSGNVDQTLAAVKEALNHFAESLARSGFAAGAGSYRQMAGIVVGQQQWAQAQGIDHFDARFREIAHLALDVHRQLHPYVHAMEQLGALLHLLPPPPRFPPDTIEGRIVAHLAAARRPLSTTQIGSALGFSNSVTRRTLQSLEEADVVARSGSLNRPHWSLRQG